MGYLYGHYRRLAGHSQVSVLVCCNKMFYFFSFVYPCFSGISYHHLSNASTLTNRNQFLKNLNCLGPKLHLYVIQLYGINFYFSRNNGSLAVVVGNLN